MTKLSSEAQINAGSIFGYDSAVQDHELGTRVRSTDGRSFVYVKAGGTALVPGKLQQSPVEDTAHQNLTITAASAIGDTTVNFTLGASLVTANEYVGGFIMVTTTPGQGYSYLIKSHPAADSSAALVVTLEDPIEVALTTSSVIDMVLSPYTAVVLNPSTATSTALGVAVNDITANQFGWLQNGGACAVLADGALSVGQQVVASNGTNGAVEDVASTTQAIVGSALTGIATGEYGAILLNLG